MTTISKEKMYEIIRSPHITEKSTMISENNSFAFKVSLCAKKCEIKQAIESLFKVEVESVNTLIIKGKKKRFKGIIGQRNSFKKAIVKLKKDSSIDINMGV